MICVATNVAPVGNLITLPTGGITSACIVSTGWEAFGRKNLICMGRFYNRIAPSFETLHRLCSEKRTGRRSTPIDADSERGVICVHVHHARYANGARAESTKSPWLRPKRYRRQAADRTEVFSCSINRFGKGQDSEWSWLVDLPRLQLCPGAFLASGRRCARNWHNAVGTRPPAPRQVCLALSLGRILRVTRARIDGNTARKLLTSYAVL
jgi:hypothetical protein